jgi:hypothetical protein
MENQTLNSTTFNNVLVRIAAGNEKEGRHENGTYGITIRFKTPRGDTNKKAAPAHFVLVPHITFPELAAVPAGIRQACEDKMLELQAAIVREAITNRAETNGGNYQSFQLALSDLNGQGIATYYTAEAERAGRLNAEQIKQWAEAPDDTGLSWVTLLQAAIADKQGWDIAEPTTEQRIKLSAVTANYLAALCKLAAPVPSLDQNNARILRNSLQLVDTTAGIPRTLAAKLDNILTKSATSLEDLL